jgi:hypothetical protein
MASILTLALSLPLGAGLSYLLEERQCFHQRDETSIGVFLWRRIHGYALITWLGFGIFLYVLWSRSDGMAMVDPNADPTTHSAWTGAFLGSLSGLCLGCGLYGSVLNYQEIRAGDNELDTSGMTVQLLPDDEELA